MDYIGGIIKACKNAAKCPKCGNSMLYVIQGEMFGTKWKRLKEEGLKREKQYTNYGILFGDDRDCTWICKKCNTEYDDYIEEIYNDCKVAKFSCIPKAYCGNLKKIKEKYGFQKNANCKDCFHFITKR